MPYEYLDEIATADVAFRAEGRTVEEVFAAAAEATMNVMVDDLSTIEERERLLIDLDHEALDLLLFNFLCEIVYYKDAQQLLLRPGAVTIGRKNGLYTLRVEMYGEKIDTTRHPLHVDVKAVTLHLFGLKETETGWQALVILDI